jgi:hypothetical protein
MGSKPVTTRGWEREPLGHKERSHLRHLQTIERLWLQFLNRTGARTIWKLLQDRREKAVDKVVRSRQIVGLQQTLALLQIRARGARAQSIKGPNIGNSDKRRRASPAQTPTADNRYCLKRAQHECGLRRTV